MEAMALGGAACAPLWMDEDDALERIQRASVMAIESSEEGKSRFPATWASCNWLASRVA